MLKVLASSVLACCGLVCSVCDACNCGHCDCGCPCGVAVQSAPAAVAPAPAPALATAQAADVRGYRTYSYQPAPVTTNRSYNYAPLRSSGGGGTGFHDATFKARGGF